MPNPIVQPIPGADPSRSAPAPPLCRVWWMILAPLQEPPCWTGAPVPGKYFRQARHVDAGRDFEADGIIRKRISL